MINLGNLSPLILQNNNPIRNIVSSSSSYTPYKLLYILTILLYLHTCTTTFNLTLLEPLPAFKGSNKIYIENILQHQFDDKVYNSRLTCSNKEFTVIEFYRNNSNPQIVLALEGMQLSEGNIIIETMNQLPKPRIVSIDGGSGNITINSGCLGEQTDTSTYFNKIDIKILTPEIMNNGNGNTKQELNTYQFSFLLGCDRGGRNKKFQVGYILIAFINAAITVGVALHSRIWSIRYKHKPLSIELVWYRYLIIILIVMLMGIGFYVYAQQQFKSANNAARYVGLVLAYIFSFICADEIFYLYRPFKREIFKGRPIRICDMLSFVVASGMFVTGFFVDSWIYYDILAIGICVGAIKLLRFSTMKQAYISMLISVVTTSSIAIVLHFKLERSYNDYASELDSPLFIMIPDLVSQLYKKCSWLPILDVIVPGVFLSFLRTYDENYNTGWGGVYTVIGNISFIMSTIFWVILEALYPYSVPFSLVTYIVLAFSIWVISRKRNQFQTLWQGRFNGANNQLSTYLLENSNNGSNSNRQSFSKLVGQDVINAVKYDINPNNEDQSMIQRENSHINYNRSSLNINALGSGTESSSNSGGGGSSRGKNSKVSKSTL